MSVSVIIPARNEEGRVGRVVTECLSYADEVIVVDDASGDGTAREAETAGARVIRTPRRSGYIETIKAGFGVSRSRVVVTIDADGEYPTDAIPALVRPIVAGEADMTQGARRRELVRWSERLLSRLAALLGPVGDSGTGLRALQRSLATELHLRGTCICGTLSLEVLSLGGRIQDVPVALRHSSKKRRIAWFHARQLGYVLRWIFRGRGAWRQEGPCAG
jgi:glycosyltransferase involved in cell wall biosynthesis